MCCAPADFKGGRDGSFSGCRRTAHSFFGAVALSWSLQDFFASAELIPELLACSRAMQAFRLCFVDWPLRACAWWGDEAAAGLDPLLGDASGVCEEVASRCEGLEAALGDVLLGCGVV
jgi:hypothetical protein